MVLTQGIFVSAVSKFFGTNSSGTSIELAKQSDVNSLKSSVSSGKAQIASAITDKGVSTSSTASFSTMANNIRAIPSITSIESAWLESASDYYFVLSARSLCTEIGYNIVKVQSGGTVITDGGTFTLDPWVRSWTIGSDPIGYVPIGSYNTNTSPPVDMYIRISTKTPTVKGIDTFKSSVAIAVSGSTSAGRNNSTCTSAQFSKASRTLTISLKFTKYFDPKSYRQFTVTNTQQTHVLTLVLPETVTVVVSTETTTGAYQTANSIVVNTSDLNFKFETS